MRCSHGMLEAKGEWVLISDADLSSPIEELDKLLAAVRQADAAVAIGSRALDRSLVAVHQSGFRELSGRFFNFVMRAFTGLPFQDTQCGFKLYRAGCGPGRFFAPDSWMGSASTSKIFALQRNWVSRRWKCRAVEQRGRNEGQRDGWNQIVHRSVEDPLVQDVGAIPLREEIDRLIAASDAAAPAVRALAGMWRAEAGPAVAGFVVPDLRNCAG